MSRALQNAQMKFQIHPSGAWTLRWGQAQGWCLQSLPLWLRWKQHGSQHAWLATASTADARRATIAGGQQLRMRWDLSPEGLQIEVLWSLYQTPPMLRWRLTVRNTGAEPLFLVDAGLLEADGPRGRLPVLPSSAPSADLLPGVQFHPQPSAPLAVIQGWQSWNFAGPLGADDRMPHTRLGPLTRPMRRLPEAPLRRGKGDFTSDFFLVLGDGASKLGLLAGFLSQCQVFGIFEARLRRRPQGLRGWAPLDGARLDPGQAFATDWACILPLTLEAPDPLANFMEAVAAENGGVRQAEIPIGWCSWYCAFNRLSEGLVQQSVAWIEEHERELPLRLVQIDDGFQARQGDWRELAAGFARPLSALAAEIRGAGLQPGLWLAPFVAHWRSKLARQNRHWILRNRFGLPAYPGFIFDTLTYPLDTTHPEVRDFLRQLIQEVVHQWGFDYLKLDFLYTAALPGRRYDPHLTRAQALRQALEDIRQAAGDETFMLGCGCPLGSAIGLVDAMRINPDVSPRWNPAQWGIEFFLHHEAGHPSTRNALRTALARLPMHRRWWINDPDCLLLRGSGSRLTPAEVQTLATAVALTGGSHVVSDFLHRLEGERVAWLRRLLAPLPGPARALDWYQPGGPARLALRLEGALGEWYLVALINWQDEPQAMDLPVAELGFGPHEALWVFDCWAERAWRHRGPQIALRSVAPHGVVLLAIRRAGAGPQWVGDTLHISAGSVVERWRTAQGTLRAHLDIGHATRGAVWLALPAPPTRACWQGQELGWEKAAEGIYRLPLALDHGGWLEVRYSAMEAQRAVDDDA